MAPLHRESLRKALKKARKLGCRVRDVSRTGELYVLGPGWRIKVNRRRKDCPLRLAVSLRQLEEKRNAG